MAVKKACKNHPHKLTSRRCYYCKEHICSTCQLHLGGHLFCSRSCYYKWRWQKFYVKAQKWPLSAIGFGLMSVFVIVLFFYSQHRLSQIEKKLAYSTVGTTDAGADSVAPQAPLLWDTVRAVQNYKLDVKVQMQPGNLTALWRDGAFTASVISKSDSVVFADQYLRPGQNVFKIYMIPTSGRPALVDSFVLEFHSARLSYLSTPLMQGSARIKQIALTFDGGASDTGTKEILRILKEKNIHCTMFLTGAFIKHFPGLVKQILSDGHQIANHTLSHLHFTQYEINKTQKTRGGVNRQLVQRQLNAADSLLHALTKRGMAPYWRAPYGEYNKDILRWAAEAGYRHVGWSRHCDTWDWEADTASVLYRTPQEILQYLLKTEQQEGLNGKIILMHLGSERKNHFPYEILPNLIDALRQRGYRFVTVSALVRK